MKDINEYNASVIQEIFHVEPLIAPQEHKVLTASDVEKRYEIAGQKLKEGVDSVFEPMIDRAYEILERQRACRERHEPLKYHRYDHNSNYPGYEGL